MIYGQRYVCQKERLVIDL